VTTGNRQSIRGIYPSPSRAMEEISMDLAENIGATRGYNHLLIVQCNFSDFLTIYPLKSKTNTEISRVLRDGIFQVFNVKRIRSDNGPGFRSHQWLETMAAMGVQIINSSSLNPSSNGSIERAVQTVKLLYKKLLATRPTYNWDYLNYLVAKVYNTTISPRNGFKPSELVFGKGEVSESFMDMETLTPKHYSIKNNITTIETLTNDIKKMSEEVKEKLNNIRKLTAEKLNKNRVNKNLQVNDYVFVKDRTEIIGATRPLKTKLDPSPYVILSVKFTTVLVQRLSDGFISLYSQDDVKKYDTTSDLFKEIPKEISAVLLHDFVELLSDDFSTITKYDPLPVPNGIPFSKKQNNSQNQSKEKSEEDNYLDLIDQELINKDIVELEKDENLNKNIQLPIKEDKEDNNDSEEEEENDNDDNDWINRLRKRVKFI